MSSTLDGTRHPRIVDDNTLLQDYTVIRCHGRKLRLVDLHNNPSLNLILLQVNNWLGRDIDEFTRSSNSSTYELSGCITLAKLTTRILPASSSSEIFSY